MTYICINYLIFIQNMEREKPNNVICGVVRAAKFCHVSPSTIRKWMEQGVIRYSRPSDKKVYFNRQELDEKVWGRVV